MPRFLYSALLYLLLPLLAGKLALRSVKQVAYRPHWRERFGYYRLPRQSGLIWLHCVSVGETRAAAPLIHALLEQYPERRLLLTHSSPSGRATSEALFGNRVQRAYLPYDLPFMVRRFLRHFQPDLGVLLETEIWFNLLAACQQRQIPVLLANARLSEKSARGYAKLGKLVQNALQSLHLIAAQTPNDAKRFQGLGAKRVETLGNLKFDAMPPSGTAAAGIQLRRWFGEQRPVFLAASTREGEEALILDALAATPIADLLTVIVPRHPQRFAEVEDLLKKRGLAYEKRSSLKDAVASRTQIILGDSMGEMYAYYASADLCLIGGSLLPFGGQNLIEAMRLGKPVLLGRHTYNFAEVAATAIAQCAAWRVDNAQEIAHALQVLMAAPEKRLAMGASGLAMCEAGHGASAKTLALLVDLLKN
ncbi:MAG: lipid IV(A) 3-deoxy-D-manno-octulosonic acid transferase [Candidatus Methylopumilus sp.]|nr:lipid IV(A) 3-deoxy-D-manno-octulosonic acid transferase [Candidatus Methylopumilus sp.]